VTTIEDTLGRGPTSALLRRLKAQQTHLLLARSWRLWQRLVMAKDIDP